MSNFIPISAWYAIDGPSVTSASIDACRLAAQRMQGLLQAIHKKLALAIPQQWQPDEYVAEERHEQPFAAWHGFAEPVHEHRHDGHRGKPRGEMRYAGLQFAHLLRLAARALGKNEQYLAALQRGVTRGQRIAAGVR